MTQAERAAHEALWAQRVADYQANGLSQPMWARAHGVSLRQLKSWLHKFRTAEATSSLWVACPLPTAATLTSIAGKSNWLVTGDEDL
ncbi:MAG: helix-turn-helix domain-containing protein [Firmicutes bacterium]|nr:helix-turn-helix domain-containing protein [Bacillota bacterium]